MFGELGYSVLDSDVVGRQVFESAEVQTWLRQELGDVEDLRGSVRMKMGDVAFRKRFDAVMHPKIFSELELSGADVLEIPLVVEAGLVSAFGVVVVCDCPLGVARERLIERVGDVELADRMLGSQVTPLVRRVFADEIIRTEMELDYVRDMVQTVANCHL